MNRLNDNDLYELHFRVCTAVVKRSFDHLSVEGITQPKHGHFDAYLARQIVVHLLVHKFGLVRRRVGDLVEMRRTALNQSMRTIDKRLEDPDFTKKYRIWAKEAQDLYLDKLAEVA